MPLEPQCHGCAKGNTQNRLQQYLRGAQPRRIEWVTFCEINATEGAGMTGRTGREFRGKGWMAATPLLALIVAGFLPTLAQAKPFRLDRGFGRAGKVVTAVPGALRGVNYRGVPIATAQTQSGGVVAGGGTGIVRYAANGSIDRRFGRNGRTSLRSPAGTRFVVQGIAVDSKGRVLVAGTTKPYPYALSPAPELSPPLSGSYIMGPALEYATIKRFLPNGKLDPSFGTNGAVDTQFDFPPPTDKGPPHAPYTNASGQGTGIVIDGKNRPNVTGTWIKEIEGNYVSHFPEYLELSYSARLSASGNIDPSFGEGGKAVGPQVTFFRGSEPPPLSSPTAALAAAVDSARTPDGGPMLLLETQEPTPEDVSTVTLVKLNRAGEFAANFGDGGNLTVRLPAGACTNSLAVDSAGHLLLAGTAQTKSCYELPAPGKAVFLTRLTSGGHVERDFGQNGSLSTSFGPRSTIEGVTVDYGRGERIVVAGLLKDPRFGSGRAFALIRYHG